jgi:hypothetical protein
MFLVYKTDIFVVLLLHSQLLMYDYNIDLDIEPSIDAVANTIYT